MTEKHSPLPWVTQPYDNCPDEGIGIVSLRDGGAYENPTNGLVAIATLLPTEIDANDPSRAQANADLIVRSVNGLPEAIAALEEIEQFWSGDDTTTGALKRLADIRTIARSTLTKLKG